MKRTKRIDHTFADNLHSKLSKLFLHTIFVNPSFLRGEISNHLEIPIEDISLGEETIVEDENKEVVSSVFSLAVFDSKFKLRFDKKVEQPKEIEVPKIVKKPRKWYQIGEPESMVIVEKKLSSKNPLTHWVLNSIE